MVSLEQIDSLKEVLFYATAIGSPVSILIGTYLIFYGPRRFFERTIGRICPSNAEKVERRVYEKGEFE